MPESHDPPAAETVWGSASSLNQRTVSPAAIVSVGGSSRDGFFMDVVAAIRVIYQADEPTLGRKPVVYLDRHGEPVPSPRAISPAEGPGDERVKPRARAKRGSKGAARSRR